MPDLICLEGPDGVGKSTYISLIKEALEKEGYKVHVFAEPSDSPIGKLIRDIIKNDVPPEEKAPQLFHLFMADRYESEKRWANLPDEDIVLLDRGTLSTLVYQVPAFPSHLRYVVSQLAARSFPRYDLLVHLMDSHEAIHERLTSRSKDSGERVPSKEEIHELCGRYWKTRKKWWDKVARKRLTVSLQDKTPSTVVEEIISSIKEI